MARAGKIILLLFLVIVSACPLLAQAEMSSTVYYIYADSAGFGGGEGASANYNLQDTTGESPTGFTTSSVYEVRGGYQAMERGVLSMDISSQSIDLGTLDNTAVNTAATTVTVTTNSSFGYTLSVESVSGTMPASVSDGAVTAGSEEYGFAASGSDSQISGDVAVSGGLVVAHSATDASGGRATNLTFKASMRSGTAAGAYNQSVVLAVSANL